MASAIGTGVAVLALTLTACGEVETASDDGYHPATVESVNPSAPPTIKLTDDAAARIDLATSTVSGSKGELIIDYAALVYDKKGMTWVYTVPKPLTFVRERVTVAKVDGSKVTLSDGPPTGTTIVTTGVTEVYGAELGMEGSH